MDNETQLHQIYSEARQFQEHFETLLMSTCSHEGIPEASYAGYIEDEGNYYVYISELAKHTKNLLEHPKCSVLFIENEASANHLLARKRLSYRCDAEEVSRDSKHFDNIIEKLIQRFGFVMNNLREMGDFHLFKLTPISGNFVAGFAKAYALSGKNVDEVRHRNEAGHKRVSNESKSA